MQRLQQQQPEYAAFVANALLLVGGVVVEQPVQADGRGLELQAVGVQAHQLAGGVGSGRVKSASKQCGRWGKPTSCRSKQQERTIGFI